MLIFPPQSSSHENDGFDKSKGSELAKRLTMENEEYPRVRFIDYNKPLQGGVSTRFCGNL